MVREKPKWRAHEGESTEAGHRDGVTRSGDEVSQWRWSEGVTLFSLTAWPTSDGRNRVIRQGSLEKATG
jgi:hypothetical protein